MCRQLLIYLSGIVLVATLLSGCNDDAGESSPSECTGLVSLQRDLIDDRELARDGELEFSGVRGADYDLDIDEMKRLVVVIVEMPTSATIQEFEDRYGPCVEVRKGSVADPLDS